MHSYIQHALFLHIYTLLLSDLKIQRYWIRFNEEVDGRKDVLDEEKGMP